MRIERDKLIEDLSGRTRENIVLAEELLAQDISSLNKKQNSESWSALECVEHLNRYSDFYIPEFKLRINNAVKNDKANLFKSSWLGEYFSSSMLPSENMKPMKTFKDKNPIGSDLSKENLQRFIKDQNEMLELLKQSNKLNLSKTKTSISISKWIKLRLGDSFRVVIYHNQRHLLQAKRASM